MTGGVVTTTWEERFWSKIALPNERGCMLWLASCTSAGYGQFFNHSFATNIAHRISYMLAYGEIPSGLELDHLCRVRSCVAPEHLDAVPHHVNVARGIRPVQLRFKRHCPQGHPYSGENLVINSRGARECRECHIARSRERYSREEAASRTCVAGHGPKVPRADGRPYCPTCQRDRRRGIRKGDPARPLIPTEDHAMEVTK